MRFLERSLQFIFVSVLPTINTALVTILRKGKTHLRPVSPSRPASDAAQVHSGLGGATCPLPGPTSGDPGRYGGREGGRADCQVAATKARALGLGTPSWRLQTPGGGRSATCSHAPATSERASRPHRRVSGTKCSPAVRSPSPAEHDPTPPSRVHASPF